MTAIREKAERIANGCFFDGTYNGFMLMTAIESALREVRREALEEAAEEAESWYELFQDPETKRMANPNQIAARIRSFKANTSSAKDPS